LFREIQVRSLDYTFPLSLGFDKRVFSLSRGIGHARFGLAEIDYQCLNGEAIKTGLPESLFHSVWSNIR